MSRLVARGSDRIVDRFAGWAATAPGNVPELGCGGDEAVTVHEPGGDAPFQRVPAR